MKDKFYSYNGNFPDLLPFKWKNTNGELIELEKLTDDELLELGFVPVDQIDDNESYNYHIHDYSWNSQTCSWDIFELSIDAKEKRIRYQQFWDFLLETNVYKKLKDASKQSLEVNVILTEFIGLLSDAKLGFANIPKFQESLLEILELPSLIDEDIMEIEECFYFCGLYSVYSIGKDYSPEEIKQVKRRIEIKIRDGLIQPH